ncbi:MAG: response regulator [Gammaproteobacteria bacterium]|nr:response regulator [Gammaproteobacteria bacterium]
MLEQARRIRALHAIISRTDLSFDEQIDETLRFGCKILGMEIGKVGRLDINNNISEFLNTVVLSDAPAKRGVKIPLDKTYCNITFSSPNVLAISDVSNSEYKDHPALGFTGVHSYIGCTISVHKEKYGTINFSNRTPIGREFNESDLDFVALIGSWISIMMERQLDADELKLLMDKAELANKAKSEFLANMSHEIRTPLTAIIGFTDFALGDGQSDEQKTYALEIVRNSSNHLLSLINDILDLSKIEAGELDIESQIVNIRELINSVAAIIGGQAARKGLEFGVDYRYPFPATIFSDELRLKQILLNLCSNALKFTEKGAVEIHVSFNLNKNLLLIGVTDTGIGLAGDDIEKVFLPFKQADASISRKYGGTGLGLPLSRQIATLLGGTLNATSAPNKGSTFILSLPVSDDTLNATTLMQSIKEMEEAQRVREYHTNQLPKLSGTVLVVDDNDVNLLLVQKYMEKTGATVFVARNGAVAVEMARKERFDLILMDMQMPVMSGVDALTELRKYYYAGPVVMLTANATLQDRSICENAGSNGFLTKPIVKEKLYQIAEKYLGRVG